MSAWDRVATDDRAITWLSIATVLACVAAAFVVYHPQSVRPFHVIDFSEFVPIQQQGTSFGDRFVATVEYYARQGRFNVIPYAAMAAKWSLFGWWSPGWQLSRALTMLALVALAFVLLRRLGASRRGSGLGASVFLFAPAASDAWVRLTMAEPLATAIVLAASIRATRFQRVESWRREVGFQALAAAGVLLSKELLLPALLLPLALALTVRANGSFGAPRLLRRNIVLLAAVGVASLAVLVPIAMLYFRTANSGYAAQYGSSWQSIIGVTAIWIANLVPFDVPPQPPSVPWALAVIGFTAVIAAGWRVGFNSATEGRNARWLLSMALLFPIAGALSYLPVPWYHYFYGLPYLVSSALLIGMAATYVEQRAEWGFRAVAVGWAFMAVFAFGNANAHAARADATQKTNLALIDLVSRSSDADTVLYARGSSTLLPYDWFGAGAALRRFASVSGYSWPPTRDIPCRDAPAAVAQRRRILVVAFADDCPVHFRAASVVSVSYRRVEWTRFRLVVDSVLAEVTPSAAPGEQR